MNKFTSLKRRNLLSMNTNNDWIFLTPTQWLICLHFISQSKTAIGALQSFKIMQGHRNGYITEKPVCHFQLVFHCSYMPIFYRFRHITISWYKIYRISPFLLCDAMHKRGLCRRAAADRPSICLAVCLTRSCIVSK